MSTRNWQGGAAAVAQQQTYLFAGTWEATDLIRATIGSRVYDFTAGSTVIATVVTALVTAWNLLDATDYPEFAELTAAVGATSATVKLTSDEAGIPFTVTLTPLEANLDAADAQEIEGAGVATTGTALVASAGPHNWSTAKNWSGGAVPVNADDVILDLAQFAIKFGLGQSAVTVASLTITARFSGSEGTVGLPEVNEDATPYIEYRDTYLAISATTLTIGGGPGTGSDMLKINLGTVQMAGTVHRTGTGSNPDLEPCLLKGTHPSNVLNVNNDARVGVAVLGGEIATLLTLRLDGNCQVRTGAGVTLGTVTHNSGTLAANSAIVTALTMLDGQVTLDGTGAVAQLNVRGGLCVYNTTGTLGGNPVVSGTGVLDFSQVAGAVAVTNGIELFGAQASVIDTDKRVTTLVVDFNEGASEGNVNWGRNVRLTRGTPA